MGVNGILIKPHGRSNAKAIKNAIRVGKSAVEQDIMSVFRELGEREGAVERPAG
jgi:glycerol-3-phosphate acyltransferase PlsX